MCEIRRRRQIKDHICRKPSYNKINDGLGNGAGSVAFLQAGLYEGKICGIFLRSGADVVWGSGFLVWLQKTGGGAGAAGRTKSERQRTGNGKYEVRNRKYGI